MSHVRRSFWGRYKRCERCRAAPGAPCTDLRTSAVLRGPHAYRSTLRTTHHELEIRETDDETIAILVDGAVVGSFNHDQYGWAGIDAAVSTAKAIARATDIRIAGEPA